MGLPVFRDYVAAHYDNLPAVNFKFFALMDEDQQFQFNVEGHVYNDVCTITDIDFAINDSPYNSLEIRSLTNIKYWFAKLDCGTVLNTALRDLYSIEYIDLRFKGDNKR